MQILGGHGMSVRVWQQLEVFWCQDKNNTWNLNGNMLINTSTAPVARVTEKRIGVNTSEY